MGRTGAVSRLGERRRFVAHRQRRHCDDGPAAYLASADDGVCGYCRASIHASSGFDLLRTLLDELNTRSRIAGPAPGAFAVYLGTLRPSACWTKSWRPYETLDGDCGCKCWSATAIRLIETRRGAPGEEQSYSGPNPKPGSQWPARL